MARKKSSRGRRPEPSGPPSTDGGEPRRPWRLWLALGAAILAVAAAAYQAVSIRQRIDSTPDKPEVAARKAGPSKPAVQPLTPSLSPATARRALEALTEESLRREMAEAATSLAQRFGDKPEALLALAAERRWQGKTAEAAERFKQCLATEPRCADAYVGLALVADQNGDAEAAAEWARRAVAIDPNSSYAARLLAHSLLSAGEFEKVIEVMEREVRLGRPSKWVFFLLGQAYSQTSAFEKARGAFARAVELAPDFTQACYGLSVACARLGRDEEAARYREKFNALKEQDQKQQRDDLRRAKDLPAMRRSAASVLVRVGQVYAKYDDRSGALAAFGRALELEPDHPEAGTAYATLRQAY